MDILFHIINGNVDESLNHRGLKTRPGARSGVWLGYILPSLVVLSALGHGSVSDRFKFAAAISSGLFVATAVFTSSQNASIKNIRKISLFFYIPVIFTALFIYVFLNEGIFISISSGVITCFSYYIGLPLLLEKFPLSFTFGEASVVIQALIIFIISSVFTIFRLSKPEDLTDMEKATLILQVGLLSVALILLIVSCSSVFKRAPAFYCVVLGVSLGVTVPILHILLGGSPILWILQLIFSKTGIVIMVIWWCFCCLLAVLVVNKQLTEQVSASTVVRKNFHYMIVAVYIPGILQECTFLYLSSGVILALFILMEAIRILNIPPLGEILSDSFKIFADEKDQGLLALTPVYLLVGCSLPLWIHPSCCSNTPQSILQAMSGVLSVGIGDTAASVGGTHFGRNKWPGSYKSIEGTVISILCQYIVLIALVVVGYIPASPSFLLRPFIVVIITSILEAKTDQVDNLVLPLVQLLLLL